MSIIIFIVILMVLVIAHEAGHFFTAKSFKIRVDEFGFGFPPKLWSFKKGETEYSINALPFGGFVKIFGESLDEADFVEVGFLDKEASPEKIDLSRSLVSKPRWKQALVMCAGIFANFLLAWFLFSFGFMSGLPTSVSSTSKGYDLKDVNLVIVSVLPKSPAELAGLKTGDKIISLASSNNKDILSNPSTDNLKNFILAHKTETINFNYKRAGENLSTQVTPIENLTDGKPGIGISMDLIGTAKLPFFRAFLEGMKLDWSVTKGTVSGLYNLIKDAFSGKGSMASVTGPVGMVSIVGDASKFGFAYLLSFAALISVNLAIINLIPFPALDGGRLLFLLIEKIKGSRIKPKVANTLNTIGFAILILLMVLVTFHDVINLF